ncbi:MAG TPA: class A beta-lactamase, subclass A2 [Bacteroidales bacterium]|nr:class A beta-lactamase, subclass A2 [Bacteroidales bacterium]
MKRTYLLFALLLNFSILPIFAQKNALRQKITNIIAQQHADVGVAIWGLESNDTLSINGNRHYPMQSVFKFHIAMAVLNKVDNGQLSLSQPLHITKSDLLPNTWSPLRDTYPNGNVNIPLSEILDYTASQSDNNGCDILLRLIGGPKTLQHYIDSLGIPDFSIKAGEEEMSKDWNVQFSNWTTPLSAAQALRKFYERKMLTENSTAFLWKLMANTPTGAKRIKGGLPKDAVVAHKTGTSGSNEQGISAAVNDIGIVVLPDSSHFAICVFVSNSKVSLQNDEKVIADIAKATWDYFVTKKD